MRPGFLILAVLTVLLLPVTPAHAEARVEVANTSGGARIDATYATTLTVRGSGFQSVQGGHGGVYVFFGTVRDGWRPSQGGATGADYFYVPDSEGRDNAGFQRYVAFPGSDTGASANGGSMSASGSWTAEIVVPGAVFEAFDRAGGSRSVDCRRVTCGVITVGAHGVTNAANESFTPVSVGELYAEQPAATVAPEPDVSTAEAAAPEEPTTPGAPRSSASPRGPPALEVDRASARAGHVLAFSATGLAAGTQVSAVLDDGTAAAGPFLVGADGRLAGVVTIPADIEAGTHELRLFGLKDPPSVRFAIAAAPSEVRPVAAARVGPEPLGVVFVAVAGLLLVLALGRLVLVRRGVRRG